MAQPITQDDLNKKQPGQQTQPGQAPTIQTFQPKQQGSGFTNTQKLLQANKANRLGQAVGQGIQQQVGQTGQNLGQQYNQFQQQTQQGRQQLQGYTQQRQNVLGRYGVGTQNVTGPTEQEIKQFQDYRNLQYGGPQQLQNEEQFQQQAQNLQDISKNYQTGAGRAAILQRFARGGGRYGAGEQTLDNLLLAQENPQAISSAVQAAQRQAADIQGKVQAAQLSGQAMANRFGAFGEDTNQAITGQRGGLSTDLDTRVKTAEEARNKRLEDIKSAVKGTGNLELSQAELEDLGIQSDLDLYSRYADEDVFRKSNLTAGRQNVASGDDYTKFQALSKLAGGPESEFVDPTQAGTFAKNQLDFNKERADIISDEEKSRLAEEMSGNLRYYLASKRNALAESQPWMPWSAGADQREVERQAFENRIANEQSAAVQDIAARQGYQGVDLGAAYGNLNLKDRGAWYDRYEGTQAMGKDQQLKNQFKTIRRILQKPEQA